MSVYDYMDEGGQRAPVVSPLRRDASFKPAQVQELEASLADHSSPFVKAFKQSLATDTAGKIQRDLLEARVAGDAKAEYNALDNLRDSSLRRQQIGTVGSTSWGDASEKGDWGNYLQNTIGGAAGSMLKPALASAAGGMLGVAPAAVASYLGSKSAINNAELDRYAGDKELSALSPQEQLDLANKSASLQAVPEAILPFYHGIGGKLPGALSRVPKSGRVVGETLGEGATEGLQSYIGQRVDQTVLPDREIDWNDIKENAIGGAIAGGAFGLAGNHTVEDISGGKRPGDNGGVANIDPAPPGTPLLGGPPSASDRMSNAWEGFKNSEAGGKVEDMFASAMGMAEAAKARFDEGGVSGAANAAANKAFDAFGAAKEAFDRAAASSQVEAANAAAKEMAAAAKSAYESLTGSPLAQAAKERIENADFGGAANNAKNSAFDKIGELASAAKDRYGDRTKSGLDRAKGTLDTVLDRTTEAVKNAKNPSEFLQMVFKGDISEEAENDLNAQDDSALVGATPEETGANMDRDTRRREERAAKFAQALLEDPATPDSVRQRVAEMGGDFSDKGNRDYVARALVSQRAGARAANAAHSLVALGKKVFGKGAGMASGALEAAADRVVKKNLQSATPHEQVAFGKIIFDELTDAAKADPVVRRQLSDITNYLVAFAAKTGDITAKDLPVLTRLSDALSMFKDPDAMVQKLVDYAGVERDKTSFVSRIRSVTSAEQDLKTPNSFLVSSLSPQIRDEALGSQAAMRRIAQLVDGFSTNGTKAAEDRVLQALAPVFGSEENALVVLDYYSKQNKANLLFDPNEMDEPAMSGELDAGETMDDGVSYKDRTINEEDASALEPRFRNANTNRPFFVGRDDKALAEIAKDGRTGSMLDYVNATNANAKLTVYDIRRDLKKRLEGHTGRDTESVQTLLKELETRLGDPKGFESAKDRADAVMLRMKLREVKTEDRSQVVGPLREELRAQDDAIAAAKEAGKDPYEAVLRLYNTTLGKPDESEASDRQMTAFRELLDKEGADEKKNEDIRKTVISVKLDGKKVNLSLQSMVKHSPEHGSIKNRLLASLALVAARTGEMPTIAPDAVVKLNHLGPGRHLTWAGLVGLRRNFNTKELFDKDSPEKLAKKAALDKITASNLRKYIDSLPREMDGLGVAKGLLGRVERALKAAVDKMDAEGDGWARTRLAKEIGELGSKKRVLRSYLREIMEADYPVDKETILEGIVSEKKESQDTGSDETEYLNILATEAQIEAYRDRARALAGTSLEEENVKEAETLVDELDRLLNSMPPHMRMTLEDRPSGRRTPEKAEDHREHIKDSVPLANVGVGESPESYGRNMPAFKYAIRNAVGEQADTVVVAASNLNSALQTAGLSDITKADLRLGGDPSGPAGFVHNGKIYLAANNIAVGGVDAAIVSSLGTNRLSTREVLGKDVAERLEKEVASWAEAPDVSDERATLFGNFGDKTVTMEGATNSAMSSLGLRPRAKGSRRGVGAETARSFANEAIAKLTNSSGEGQFSLQDLVDVAHYVSSETLKNPSALERALNAHTADTTANSGVQEKTEPPNTKPTGSKNPAASSRGVAEAVNNHRALSDSALSALHDVVVNENYDRLSTPDKVLRFASMAKQALEQILSIPEMDRTEQQVDLRYKLDRLFKKGAMEFDWDSLWDGLEPTEAQRARLKDITNPKVEPGESGQRVVLPGSGAFIAKDQAKSDRANKFIGRGVAGSSTARYAAAWGDRANTGVYAPSDVVFVSSNGNRAGRVKPDFVEIGKAVKAGATIIGDTAFHRGREFNIGEREVAAFLEKNNYVERGDGEWVPSQGLVTPEGKQSTMKPKRGRPGKIDQQEILDEIARIRGKDVEVVFAKFADIGASGEFSMNADKTRRVIKVAVNSLDPKSVAWHESLHDFFAMLGTSKAERKLKEDLLRAAEDPKVVAQLRDLLKDHPMALEQIESDREERLAYMYQFWAAGAIELRASERNIFQKLMKMFRDMVGVLSNDEKIDKLFDALHSGRLVEPNLVTAVLADLKANTLGDKLRAVSGPIGDTAAAMFTGATDRLRDTNIDALAELADLFHTDLGIKKPDAAGGELSFLQRRSQSLGRYRNRLDNILADTTAEERQQALENFQSMKAPSSELEREIATFLGDMHAYLIRNDVRRLDSGSRRWVPISKVDKYFPRVWDKNTIRNNEAGFISLLEKYVGKAQARNTFEAIVGGDGSLELKENEHSLGYSPWMAAVNDRQFTFINESNAAEFAKFQSKDLMDTLVSYTQSAVHRAEHSRSFGYNSGRIQSLLAEASKQGASSEELIMASKAVLALEGTLGHDFNPRLKEVMSGIQTVENVILLPLALFTNLVDPIGVAIRSNDMGEAWNAFKYGIKGVVDALMRNGEDAETEMAKLIGIIDNQNMLDAMGHVYNSMNMSPFLKRVNDKFFKYNGMELWNQRMRVAAMGAAQRFIVKNLGNKRYMDELGITEKDVFQLADGTIALTKDQLLQAGAANSKVEEIEKRIQSAVFKWVDGAVLRPNAAHRPIWGSDPRFQLIFHLKQFTFSFHNTIIKRVQSEVRHGNSKPAWILMSYVPFMFLSDVAKGSLLGTVNTMGDLANVAAGSVARSGILGTGTFGLDAVGDLTRDKVPGTSFMGPTFDHAMTILTGILGSTTSGQVLDRSVPFVKYL